VLFQKELATTTIFLFFLTAPIPATNHDAIRPPRPSPAEKNALKDEEEDDTGFDTLAFVIIVI
jgi:hypothetical protein